MGYSKDAVKGIGWIGLFRFGAKGVVFLKIIAAYRYLSPRDVGLFGLCAIALGLLEMFTETGINIILVRDSRPISYYLDTAFIVSVVRGILIGGLLALSSLFLPAFFRDDGLFPLLLWVSIIPIVKGFINPAIATFTKDLHYHKEALLRIFLAVAEALFAIFLVRLFHSASSLLWSMIAASFLEVFISFAFIKPRPKLAFKSKVCTEIINPGKWINLAGILSYAEQNFDNILVGRVLGATQLGYYQTAFNLGRSLITEVGVIFSQVLTPIMSRFQTDRSRMERAFVRMLIPAGISMLIPLGILNFPPAQEILFHFLQDKWRPILPLLPYLTIGAWITGVTIVGNAVYLVRDEVKTLVALYIVALSSLLTLMYYMTTQFGILGAVQAVLIVKVVMAPLFGWKTFSLITHRKKL